MRVTKELHHRTEALRRHAPFAGFNDRRRPEAPSTPHTPSARGAANAHRIGVPLMHSLWNVRVHGAANVPEDGAVILAGNHTSFLDGPLIVGVSPRPVHFLVKQEIFVGPLGPILHGLGQIPVDRKRPDRAAVQAALATLRAAGCSECSLRARGRPGTRIGTQWTGVLRAEHRRAGGPGGLPGHGGERQDRRLPAAAAHPARPGVRTAGDAGGADQGHGGPRTPADHRGGERGTADPAGGPRAAVQAPDRTRLPSAPRRGRRPTSSKRTLRNT